jgi:hypothetical protein
LTLQARNFLLQQVVLFSQFVVLGDQIIKCFLNIRWLVDKHNNKIVLKDLHWPDGY